MILSPRRIHTLWFPPQTYTHPLISTPFSLFFHHLTFINEFFSYINCGLALIELLLSLLALITTLGFGLVYYREMKRSKVEILELVPAMEDFVWQQDGEWKMDERLVKVFDMLGSRIAQSGKMALMQQMGADAKNVKAVDKAIGADMMDASGIGGILDVLGLSNVKRQLIKNPKTMAIVAQRIAPMIQNMNNGGSRGQDSYRGKY